MTPCKSRGFGLAKGTTGSPGTGSVRIVASVAVQALVRYLNLTSYGDTKDAARRFSRENVITENGKLDMKLFGFGLFGQAIKAAGIGVALMVSVSAGNAQSGGPFAGFDGAWSGTGTVALSDGTTERIRCKADYKVNGSGLGLKQSLHGASDSYKF